MIFKKQFTSFFHNILLINSVFFLINERLFTLFGAVENAYKERGILIKKLNMSKIADFNFKAVILDMDGVITKTAVVHAKAWKEMFDDFLKEHMGDHFEPLDIETDYTTYIDGIPRLDGVRNFLASRSIRLPEGRPDDLPEKNTVYGLACRKNKLFLKLIEREGVKVYEDTREMLNKWKKENIKLAVISSSRNCQRILEKAGMEDWFEVRVDGVTLENEKLTGKPAPDIFLKAAEYLNVAVDETLVIEDAILGVQAGKKGKFYQVVGVARNTKEKSLADAGADIVVKRLTELKNLKMEIKQPETLPNALNSIEKIMELKGQEKFVLFLDFDGTLSPIVSNPKDAELPDANREIIQKLSEFIPVAVISGRDRKDVKSKVAIDTIIYAGSHGFDISGPENLEMNHESEKEVTPALNKAEKNLNEQLKNIKGVIIERKKFAIAVHYRNVKDSKVQKVTEEVDKELRKHPVLKGGSGKKVLELKPDIDWNKGRALDWLTEKLGWDKNKYVRIYIGDDITDEDAFKTIKGNGIGILVGSHGKRTSATYILQDPGEVTKFLKQLKQRIQKQ